MRHLALLAIPVVFAASVAACSSDETSSATSPPDGGTTATDSGGGNTDASNIPTDSSAPVDAADAAGPWTPAQLTGLVLWLDGDSATPNVSSTVDTWTDKSPAHNNAVTANAAQKPHLLTGPNGINGHQALAFDGTANFLTIADSASLRFTQSFVMEIVFRHAAATGSETFPIYAKQTDTALNAPKGPSILIGSTLTNPYPSFIEALIGPGAFVDTDKTVGFAPGTHRVRVAWDLGTKTLSAQLGTTGTLVSGVQNSVVGLDATGKDAFVGKDLNDNFLKGDLAELVVLTGAAVPAADVTMLQGYLDKKYGL